MSIVFGGGKKKWATLATILLFGVVIVFVLPYIAQTFLWIYATYLNTTAMMREEAARVFGKNVSITEIEIKSQFGNYTAYLVKPVNYPFNTTLYNYLYWIAQTTARLLSEPIVWASIVALFLINVALSLKEQS